MKLGRRSVFFLFSSLISTALAHDPGLSSAAVRVTGETITTRVTLVHSDIERLVVIDVDHDGKVSAEEFKFVRGQLEAIAPHVFSLAVNGQPISPKASTVELDAADGIVFSSSYLVRGTHLTISSELLPSLPRGHRQYFTVCDEQNRPLTETMLDSTNHRLELQLAASPQSAVLSSFSRFLILGINHIVTGYDHLAFLLGLLLVGGGFRAALKIVTAFTLAHSITLALATFNLIRLSPGIVEPLIAASIVYVGVENIFHRSLGKRWLLAFGFGLIHGCGFATVLKEAGIGADDAGVALPSLSFNLGVELGQIAIAVLVLPLIWKLKQTPTFAFRYAPACSALIVLAGSYWLIERVLA